MDVLRKSRLRAPELTLLNFPSTELVLKDDNVFTLNLLYSFDLVFIN